MDIVLTTDANYVMPCGVLLLSLCKSNPDVTITVHIICDNSVGDKEKEDLKQTVCFNHNLSIKYYHIEGDLFDNYPSLQNAYLSKAAYYRLFLTDILPSNIDKVLYLDCDLLVLNSLKDLWQIDLKDFALAAIIDSMECYHVEWYNRLRYNPAKLYFNSGVMLINLKYWRTHDSLVNFMSYLENYRERIVSHDQDILNVIFQDHKILLPIKYNLQEGFLYRKRRFFYWDHAEEFAQSIENPVILHYTVNKPWQKTCKHPMKKIFLDLCNQTVWKGFKMQNYPVKKKKCIIIKSTIKKSLEILHLIKKQSPYIDISTLKQDSL